MDFPDENVRNDLYLIDTNFSYLNGTFHQSIRFFFSFFLSDSQRSVRAFSISQVAYMFVIYENVFDTQSQKFGCVLIARCTQIETILIFWVNTHRLLFKIQQNKRTHTND